MSQYTHSSEQRRSMREQSTHAGNSSNQRIPDGTGVNDNENLGPEQRMYVLHRTRLDKDILAWHKTPMKKQRVLFLAVTAFLALLLLLLPRTFLWKPATEGGGFEWGPFAGMVVALLFLWATFVLVHRSNPGVVTADNLRPALREHFRHVVGMSEEEVESEIAKVMDGIEVAPPPPARERLFGSGKEAKRAYRERKRRRRRRRRAIRRRKRALLRRKLEKERAAHAAAAASVSSGGKDKSDDIVRSAKGAASGGAGGNEGNREGEGKGGAIEMDASLLEILDFESESESSSSDEDDQDGNDPEDGRFTVSDEFDEFDNDLEVGTPRLKGKKSGRRRKRGGQGGIGDAGVGDERNEDEDGYESREGRGLLGDRGDPLYHDRRGYEHPLRSVFCSYADAQVANYDHYCSIIATTVGEANHCRFWWFLFAATICNFVASKTVYSGFRFVPSVSLWFSFNGWHLFYALIYWSMFVTVFCLFLMHTWFALSNMNSNEFMRADKIPYLRGTKEFDLPFSRGVFTNLQLFCCASDAMVVAIVGKMWKPVVYEPVQPIDRNSENWTENLWENKYWSCC